MKGIHQFTKQIALLATAAAVSFSSLHAQSTPDDWWHGQHATGEWFGLRATLEDRGIKAIGKWKGTFYGVVDGGLQQRGAFDEQLVFKLVVDLEKLAGLSGLSLTGAVRWRDGDDVNQYVGASPAFSPTNTQVGKQWRLMPVFATWKSGDLFGPDNLLTISGGWTNPYFSFIQQPASSLFVNNAIQQTKGFANSGFPWSGSYNTWGGHLRLQPVSWHYAQAGLYLAIPGALATGNHGLSFEGARPASRNGLYFIGETGVTPKLGDAKLPGKYAFGGIYFGLDNRSFFGTPYEGRYAFYWQADQMIYREPAPEQTPVYGKSPSKGVLKEVKSVTEPPAPTLSEQGLYFFSFLNYAPKYNNRMPFYFHTGLVYKGPIPGRDKDQAGIAFGYGNYSYYKQIADRQAGRPTQSYEAVLEFDYRVQMSDFVYVQPYAQYLIRPNGTGLIENATVLGFEMGVDF